MASEAIPAPKPYRGWPTAAARRRLLDFPDRQRADGHAHVRALSVGGRSSALLFLVLFLVLWLSNGLSRAGVRLLGLGLILSGRRRSASSSPTNRSKAMAFS